MDRRRIRGRDWLAAGAIVAGCFALLAGIRVTLPVRGDDAPEVGADDAGEAPPLALGPGAADPGAASRSGRLEVPPGPRVFSSPPVAAAPEPAAPTGPPPALHGVVTTDDWFPVANTDVAMTLERPVREGAAVTVPGRALARTRTDADGRFAFASAPEGPLFLAVAGASHPLGGPLAGAWVAARAGPDEVTITLLGRPGIWLRAIDADGAPIPDAELSLAPPYGTPAWVRCGADGWALVPLARPAAPAALRVNLRPPARRTDVASLEGASLETLGSVPREPSVSGSVEDADGRPAAGARVYGRNAAWGPEHLLPSTVAGTDGRFRLGRVGAGRVEIRAVSPNGPDLAGEWPTTTAGVGDTDVRLALPPVADVALTVEGVDDPAFVLLRRRADEGGASSPARGERAGAERPRARRPDPASWVMLTTDGEGRVVFPEVPSDRTYVAWMLPDREGRTFVLRDVRPGGPRMRVRADRGRVTPLRVDPPRGGWIEEAWALDATGVAYAMNRRGGEESFPALPDGLWHVLAVVRRPNRPGDLRSPPSSGLGVDPDGASVAETLETDVAAGADVVLAPTAR